MGEQLLAVLSPERVQGVLACLNVDALLALEVVCSSARGLLRDTIERRCMRACFSTYLYPTMATYSTMAAAPESWKLLYLQFSRLREMEWTACKTEGTSSTLRSLKADNQEYIADHESGYILRSGGHYWFSVLQTPLGEVSLSNLHAVKVELEQQLHDLSPSGEEMALAFLRSPSSITVSKWEKLRGDGPSPCPRRHHSMTVISSVECSLNVLYQEPQDTDSSAVGRLRRVVFFGGQAEGIPFEAFNDLHVLLIDGRGRQASTKKTMAWWVRPDASGQSPSRRCGHEATPLSDDTLLISGGSDGTTPRPTFEVFVLHIQPDGGYGSFRWSTPVVSAPPSGRAMHNVHRIASDEVLVFGGRQIRQSNGLLNVNRLKLHVAIDSSGEEIWRADWSEPALSGCIPSSRRGHCTVAIGDNLVLIGGQDAASGDLHCDVRVLDVQALHWRVPRPISESAPCPRRGFKTQYFGTSLVVSSGFVRNETTTKVDQQLPDSDIHVLTFR